MASATDAIATVGAELGLAPPVRSGTSYGVRHGFLVQLSPAKDAAGHPGVSVRVDYRDDTRDDVVRRALAEDDRLVAARVKAKRVSVKDGAAVCFFGSKGLMRAFSAERLKQAADAMLDGIREAVPEPPPGCRSCGPATPADPVLINGTVDRLCGACIAELEGSAADAQAAYDAIETRIGLTVVAALGAALAGAVAWAAIGIGTGRMFWLLAIAIGALTGGLTARAAGKGGRFVQAVAVVATVASVLAGNVLMCAYFANQEMARQGLALDWMGFLEAIPQILVATGSDTLFALGGGLFGAFSAAGVTGRKSFAVQVE